jgi:hypothetical protein
MWRLQGLPMWRLQRLPVRRRLRRLLLVLGCLPPLLGRTDFPIGIAENH